MFCNRGWYIDEHYCVTSGYEPPDINIEIGKSERCFFRLLVVPEETKIQEAKWISLPCEKEELSEFYNGICLDFQSSLPMITEEYFSDMKLSDELNYLAQKLSELSKTDFVKLKAVMEAEEKHEIYEAFYCMRDLNEYEFDKNISDQSDFGRAYLLKNLPANFDISMFESMEMFDFGQGILTHNHGEITSYGAISGRGQDLYSALTVQPEQQLEEDIEEDMEEDFEMEMGGMSL